MIFGKRHQKQVHGVEHQLNAHEDDDRVAAYQHTDDTDAEKCNGEPDVTLYGHTQIPRGLLNVYNNNSFPSVTAVLAATFPGMELFFFSNDNGTDHGAQK
jgi:hypothetical protein